LVKKRSRVRLKPRTHFERIALDEIVTAVVKLAEQEVSQKTRTRAVIVGRPSKHIGAAGRSTHGMPTKIALPSNSRTTRKSRSI
jgi:hypothetical protein